VFVCRYENPSVLKKNQRNECASDPHFVVPGFLRVYLQLIGGYRTFVAVRNKLAFVLGVAVHITEFATIVPNVLRAGKPPASPRSWKAHVRSPQEHRIRSNSFWSARYLTRPPVGDD